MTAVYIIIVIAALAGIMAKAGEKVSPVLSI